MLDLRTGKVCKTLIPKISEGIFDVMAVFNATNEYVLYYHSGRKTIRAFRRKDGTMIANFRVQADLKGMETTADGRLSKTLDTSSKTFFFNSSIQFRNSSFYTSKVRNSLPALIPDAGIPSK